MRIQLVDQATRTNIGNSFKLDYRINVGDEVYYVDDISLMSPKKTKWDDTVWSVTSCRTESFDTNKQIVFVIPKSSKATRLIRNEDER